MTEPVHARHGLSEDSGKIALRLLPEFGGGGI